MIFQTPVTDYGNTFEIGSRDKILALGSCFASVVGQRLSDNLLKIMLNPFGTLYNPKSICSILQLCLDRAENIVDIDKLINQVIFKSKQGLWYSWLSSSIIHGNTHDECKEQFLQTLDNAANWLKELDVLMVTFGTTHYYSLNDGEACGLCVANCHKMTSGLFDEGEMLTSEIVENLNQILFRLKNINPDIKLLISVSPYRYLKYGLHQSQISKASLLLSIEQFMRDNKNVFYYPAYEILNDELRDYRFYAADMVHPSSVAEDYIWERFCHFYLDEQVRSFMAEWSAVLKMKAHKPSSAAAAQNLDSIVKVKTEIIKGKYPFMF